MRYLVTNGFKNFLKDLLPFNLCIYFMYNNKMVMIFFLYIPKYNRSEYIIHIFRYCDSYKEISL